MKILVATHLTQGQRENDICCCKEGELVFFGSRCDDGTVDDNCGCCRSMIGMDCLQATTTVKCTRMEVTASWLAEQLLSALDDGGWPQAEKIAEEMALSLERAVEDLKVGPVYEYRDDRFIERPISV